MISAVGIALMGYCGNVLLDASMPNFHWIESWNRVIVHLMPRWLSHTCGTALCLAAAGGLTLIFRESPFKHLFPFVFLGIIAFIATRFGSASGVFGTVGAAIIFAAFLFQPMLSLRVKDFDQRSNLLWMVVGGIAASELLGTPTKDGPRQSKKRLM
jgi:integral membrane sensor domain MASE1